MRISLTLIVLLALSGWLPSGVVAEDQLRWQQPPAQVQAAFAAVSAGDTAELLQLIDSGLDLRARNVFGMTLIDAALMRYDYETLEILLAGGLPYTYSWDETDPLDTAAFTDDLPLVELLLKYGADPLAGEVVEDSPVFTAARQANPQTLRAFIAAGVDTAQLRSAAGDTLLHTVADYYEFDIMPQPAACARLLVNAGIDVNAVNTEGQTPLHVACAAFEFDDSPKRLDLVSCLIELGADLNLRNADGRTPLFAAAAASARVVERLLQLGANPNIADNNGQTALHMLARWAGESAVMRILLRHRADPNRRDNEGYSALEIAVQRGRTEAQEVLLAFGARQDLATLAGRGEFTRFRRLVENKHALGADPRVDLLALNLALKFEQGEIAQYLLTAGVPPSLYACVKLGDSERLKQRLAAGADVEEVFDNMSALQHAVACGELELIRQLAAHGAALDRQGYQRRTPLETAVRFKQYAALTLLLELGADPNSRIAGDSTALHWACRRSDIDAVQLLLDAGADVNARQSDQQTPLHAAVFGRDVNLELIQLLLQRGAEVDAIDYTGRTPLAWVVADSTQRNAEVVKLLLDAGANPNINDELAVPILGWCTAYFPDTAMAELLLEHDADPDPLMWSNQPLMVEVVASGNVEMAQLLRQYGAQDPPQWLVDQACEWGLAGVE